MLIQASLAKSMSLTQIAARLKRNKSSISREISKHLEVKEGFVEKQCIHKKEYFVCNVCPFKNGCGHKRIFYNFEIAARQANDTRKLSRLKTRLTKKQIKIIDEILVSKVREPIQSLHPVYIANPILQSICSERTIRRSQYIAEI